jgi:phage-related protein
VEGHSALGRDDEATPFWKVLFFRDERGNEPVKEFFLEAGLTDGEKKQLEVRIKYLAQRGLQLVLERADILDKVETERGLYELRLDNTPNNPRVLLCSARGRRIVLLHAFKKKGRRLPVREVETAKHRRDMWLRREGEGAD